MLLSIGEEKFELDLLDAEKEFQEIELTVGCGRSPTAELLTKVSGWLKQRFGVDVTHSIAWQVWWAVYERIDVLRKDYEQDAEIAYWFHVEPFALPAEKRIGLLSNLPRVKAQATLHSGKYPGTDYKYVHNLVLLATGSKQLAAKARAEALERYVDHEIAKGARNK